MEQEIGTVIDQFVGAMYELHTKEIEEGFIQLLDCIEKMLPLRNDIEWKRILMKMQTMYVEKDYVSLADLLLDEIKEKIEK